PVRVLRGLFRGQLALDDGPSERVGMLGSQQRMPRRRSIIGRIAAPAPPAKRGARNNIHTAKAFCPQTNATIASPARNTPAAIQPSRRYPDDLCVTQPRQAKGAV